MNATITTAKGSKTGTIEEICVWQAEMQGAFADIEIGGETYDVSSVVFDGENINATVARIMEVFSPTK